MDSELRVYLQKQMHMVWHDFHFDDFKLVFVGYGADELLCEFSFQVQGLGATP